MNDVKNLMIWTKAFWAIYYANRLDRSIILDNAEFVEIATSEFRCDGSFSFWVSLFWRKLPSPNVFESKQ